MQRKKILIICPFPVGVAAGQRLKYEQYFSSWNENGIDVTVSNFMDQRLWEIVYRKGFFFQKVFRTLKGYCIRLLDLFRLHKFDAIYIFMWVTPFGSNIPEKLFKKFSKKLIFDVEDSVLTSQNIDLSNNPNPLLAFFKNSKKADFLIREANFIITSSPFLNEYCIQKNKFKNSQYISSSVDARRFVPTNNYSNDEIVTIGWTGTFSSRSYLDSLAEVFQTLALRVEFKLRVIGNFEYKLPGVNLEVIQWSSENEVKDLQGIDIGIYPLQMDEWVMGKSGLKAIQYMAFGLPVVATNVGTTPLIITHNETGILVDSKEDWVNALELLILDPKLRRKIGTNARSHLVKNYSTDAVQSHYNNVLTQVLGAKND